VVCRNQQVENQKYIFLLHGSKGKIIITAERDEVHTHTKCTSYVSVTVCESIYTYIGTEILLTNIHDI